MYSYISENNFGPSNQIIVPTGYILHYKFWGSVQSLVCSEQ